MKKFLIFMIIIFFLFVVPSSSSLSREKVSELFLNENQSIILISLPKFMHDPETWNTIYSDVLSITHLKNRTIRKLLRENLLNDNSIPKIRKFIRKNTLNGKSIPEVAAIYDGVVYANRPEYAYCKIIFPKENYENITEAFKSLGFKVRDNIPMEFDLDYSRDAINLPYIYYEPGGEYELTGSGRTIAIIDSGIEDSHDDFPGTYPDSTAKIIFWNDTTPERYSCCVDEFGHGVHVASIAAGTGSASEGLYKGVAPDAKLKIWKVSVGASVSTEAVAEATWQAITQGADVISMSLSAPATSDMCTGNWYGQYNEDYYDLYEAVTNAISNGITVVSSAGNTGPLPGTIRFPACVDGVIAVGSTLKKDYPDHYYEIGKDGSEFEVNAFVEITSDNPPTTFSYSRYTDYLKDSGFQKVIQPNNWPATVDVEIEGQYLDWCLDDSQGDLTVTCIDSVPTLYKTQVIECWEDCRDKGFSPDSICQKNYGTEWHAIAVDCELIDIKNAPDGDYIRTFDSTWNSDNSNGWCEDTGGEDMTVTCAHTGAKPNYKVLVRECNGDCMNEGNPNGICQLSLGIGWHAIGVDCEEIGTGSEENLDKDFNDNVGTWCRDQLGEDMTVTCAQNPSESYKVRIIECNWNGEGCSNEGLPDDICQNAYGNSWYALSVDCELIEIPNENKNWNREVYHPKTLSGLSGEAIVVEVFKPFSGSINDVIVNVFKTNVLSTEGLAVHSSSRGPAPQLIVKPDVTAPGKEICAARVSDSSILENKFNCKLTCGNDNYISCSGTSMATPHVAGLVALLKEADSNLEVDDVREALRKADNKLILSSNPDNVEGDGRINSRKAGDSVTNCGSYEAYDLYDSGNEPKVYGSCCEHSWSGDRCIEACHDDYCNGDQVYEYYAFGSKCIKSLEDCRYGTDWTCSNGKCVYSPPPPPDDGGNGGGCNGPCGCQPCTTPI